MMNMTEENGMVPMTDEEFDTYFALESDHPDIMEKAAAVFAQQPDLPYVEIGEFIVPNRKLLEDGQTGGPPAGPQLFPNTQNRLL